MPDLPVYSTTQAAAATRRAGTSFLSHWERETRPQLVTIKVAALDLLEALEKRFAHSYRPEELASLAAYAADTACGALELIDAIEGGLLSEADEHGVRAIAEENLLVDRLPLQLAGTLWKARAEARQAPAKAAA